VAKGYSPQEAQQIYDLIEPFAGYAFNKAHAVSYATIAYQTAYLKANYPEEYMTAVLIMASNHPAGAAQRVAEAYAECRRRGIAILPPDVNHSGVNFSLEGHDDGRAIRFGLANVKNVGEGMVEGIIEARDEGGPFDGVDDFFARVNYRHLNKRALESMTKAGAFDALCSRNGLLASLDRTIANAQRSQRQREAGQGSLFDLLGEEEKPSLGGLNLDDTETPQSQRLAWEKELLGVYVSEHPFARAAQALEPHLSCRLAEVSADLSGRQVVLGGTVIATRSLTTRDGRPFLAATIEEETGASLEITVWPDTYEVTREIWEEGTPVVAAVRVRTRDERLQLGVQRAVAYVEGEFDPASLTVPRGNGNGNRWRNSNRAGGERGATPNANGIPNNGPERLRIVLEETDDHEEDEERLRSLVNALREYEGEGAVHLSIQQRDGEQVEMELPRARYCPELEHRLGEIVGPWGTVGA
jgi:DNA polymerase-3 subunit alpha